MRCDNLVLEHNVEFCLMLNTKMLEEMTHVRGDTMAERVHSPYSSRARNVDVRRTIIEENKCDQQTFIM